MAIGTPTSIGSAQNAVAATSIAMTCSASVASGQFVVAVASCSGLATTCTFTDSGGNTWTTNATSTGASNGLCFIGSAQITNALTTSSTITATFGTSATSKLVCAVQVSGIATSSAIDKTITANGTAVGWSTGASATTAQADELVIAACGNDSSSTETNTAGATYTELFDFATSTAAELTMIYKIVSATGAQTGSGTWTNSGSRGWNAALATFKGAAGGTDATVTALPMTTTALLPVAAVSGGGAGTVASVPAISTARIVAPTIQAGATVTAVPMATTALTVAPAGLSATVTVVPIQTVVNMPAATVAAGGDATVTAVPMISTSVLPVAAVSSGSNITAAPMITTSIVRPAVIGAGAGVDAAPFRTTALLVAPAVSPAPAAPTRTTALPLTGVGS